MQAFEALPEAGALAAANKRIVNILRKSGERGGAPPSTAARLADGAEHDLWQAFQTLAPVVDDALRERRLRRRADGARGARSPPSTASSTT